MAAYLRILILFLLPTVFACNKEVSFPQELVMADSAYMQGNYKLGDALLESYNKQHDLYSVEESNYYDLLMLTKTFMYGDLSSKDFSTADSLERYYSSHPQEASYAKVLLYIGSIYKNTNDYPSALSYFLKSKEIAKKNKDGRLLCLLSRCIGDLYFEQQMYEESIPYYRKYYSLAIDHEDTLRIMRQMDYLRNVWNVKLYNEK